MPYEIQVDPEFRIGFIAAFDYVTGQDLVLACKSLIEDASWEAGFDEVWDLSAATAVDISPDELERLAASAREHADRIGENRVACVTTRDSMAAILRLLERLTPGLRRTYRVARTRQEAADWLGVPLPPAGAPPPS
ncbi:hypothetical protein [Rubrivirga sp.]|uniref:hypothetical protein n=1 Tax=Rubrivirga sp. TaxID=1885344 RepID=UPI003B516BA0